MKKEKEKKQGENSLGFLYCLSNKNQLVALGKMTLAFKQTKKSSVGKR